MGGSAMARSAKGRHCRARARPAVEGDAMRARIYQPTKTAMQSGRAGTRHWVLEYRQAADRFVEPLMGWTGAHGTLGQVGMRFPSREAAIAYAKRHGIEYDLVSPQKPRLRLKTYSDNFAFDRPE